MTLPDYLKSAKPATIFPVLADTNREQRITSILLSLMPFVPSMASEILGLCGQKIGARSRMECYVEPVFKTNTTAKDQKDRPDGLIILHTGKRVWRALVETKIGKADLEAEQVTRYVNIARENNIDCVITISNQFVTRADQSPVEISKNLLRKTSLFHLSWISIKTVCENIRSKGGLDDREQLFLLEQFCRFLDDPNTGIENFNQMSKTWKALVQAISSAENLKKTSPEVLDAAGCWIQEEKDLCLQMSMHIGEPVDLKIGSKLLADPQLRLKSIVNEIVEVSTLTTCLSFPNVAGDIELCVDLKARSMIFELKIKAPADRKTTKARANWLLRMLKTEDPRISVRAYWPGRSPYTQKDLAALREDSQAIQADNDSIVPHSFGILLVHQDSKRFVGSRTFIEDLEAASKTFYNEVAQHIKAWQPPPPKPVKVSADDKADAEEIAS